MSIIIKESFKTTSYHRKVLIVIIIFVCLLSLFIYRSYQLTTSPTIPYYSGQKRNKIRRGNILDALGQPLALSADNASIGVRPIELVDIDKTASLLSKIINRDASSIQDLIHENRTKNFFWLERKVDMGKAHKLTFLKIPGIDLHVEPGRYYPYADMALPVLGFIGVDNEGLAGLEFQYNDVLSFDQNNITTSKQLYLTIHTTMQRQMETTLKEKMRISKSKRALGIIMEVATGKILALASLSNEDLRLQESKEMFYKNRAVVDIYEPGSTFKIITMSALLAHGVIKPNQTFFCPGYIRRKDFKINCTRKHGKINFRTVVKTSCNTGIILASEQLSDEQLDAMIRKFGFGSATHINLPGESRGIVPHLKKWDHTLRMSIPIGYGVAGTPLQLLTAVNSIFNGGMLLKPIIVDRISTIEERLIYKAKRKEIRRVVSSKVAQEVMQYLSAVTEVGGTGHNASINSKQGRAGGKTGTSIKVGRHGYTDKIYQVSFIGAFPILKPKISMFILFDEPQYSRQGGLLAAPAFKEILESILPLLYRKYTMEVTPLKKLRFSSKNFLSNKMPNFIGRSKKDVMQIIWKHYPGDHKINGTGYVITQNPHDASLIAPPYKFTITLGYPE